MSRRSRRWWNILGKLFDAFMDNVSDVIPEESKLRSDLQEMVAVLERKSDIASYNMARADEKREQLRFKIEEYEAYQREAENFFRQGDEEAAKRCVALRLATEHELTALQEEYLDIQKQAEQSAQEFLETRHEVGERRKKLPKLQEDARVLRAERQIARESEQHDLDSAKQSFDDTARELRIRQKQLQNRNLLMTDPHAELDRRIRASLEEKQLSEAMDRLRKQVGKRAAVNAEFEVMDGSSEAREDPATAAKRLIEAPRYKGVHLDSGRQADAKQLPQLNDQKGGGA